MVLYYKFREGAPRPEDLPEPLLADMGDDVKAEEVEVHADEPAALDRRERRYRVEDMVEAKDMSPVEKLKMVREMALPLPSEEERWRELRTQFSAEEVGMMLNESVQRSIRSGVSMQAAEHARLHGDSKDPIKVVSEPGADVDALRRQETVKLAQDPDRKMSPISDEETTELPRERNDGDAPMRAA